MQIIIGSRALQAFNMNRNEPKDLDIWGNEPQWNGMDAADYKQIPTTLLSLIPTAASHGDIYATPDAIYTIKCSHLGWRGKADTRSVLWNKTKLDILWLHAKGCKLLPELYDALILHWQKEFGTKSFLSLAKDADEFFADNVKYIVDHDYLHTLVSHPYDPMYTHVLKENEDVLIDNNKWDVLPCKLKVRMLREEITVIAIERWLIHDKSISVAKAYNMALQKTITTLTKGRYTDFIVQNLHMFTLPDYNDFKHALQVLNIERNGTMDGQKLIDDILESYNSVKKKTWDNSGFREDMDESELVHEVFGYEEYSLDDFPEEDKFRILEQDGGGEGGSEYCYIIFTFRGKTYKGEYSYYSHQGYEMDYFIESIKEVQPVQKTVTVYE